MCAKCVQTFLKHTKIYEKSNTNKQSINIVISTFIDCFTVIRNIGSLSKRTDAKILIIIFKLLDGSLIVFLF